MVRTLRRWTLWQTALAGVTLAGCATIARPGDDRTGLSAYLDGRPVAPVAGCLNGAADAAGRARSDRLAQLADQCNRNPQAAGDSNFWRMIAGGAFATDRFAFARDAAGRALAANPATAPPWDRAELAQLQALAAALAEAPPMTLAGNPVTRVAATRDAIGLVRIPTLANGQPQSMVVDTGAALPLMRRSLADRLGLTVRHGASVGSSTREDVATDWAVMPTLVIGEARLANVIFLVMPDSALELPVPGGYALDAVIGLPVLRALQTMCTADGMLSFAPTRAVAPGGGSVPMRLTDSSPMLSMTVNDQPVTMFLDSGANRSSLSTRFALAYPDVVAGAASEDIAVGGAGGVRRDRANKLANARFQFGSSTITLPDVTVARPDGNSPHEVRWGVVGQDVLAAAQSWSLDFGRAQFTINGGC